MTTEFGKRVKQARLQAGFKSQQALADATGISQSTIASMETKGHSSPHAPKIATACRVSLHWLTTGQYLPSPPIGLSNSASDALTHDALTHQMLDALVTLVKEVNLDDAAKGYLATSLRHVIALDNTSTQLYSGNFEGKAWRLLLNKK